MKKRIIHLMLAAVMALMLCACTGMDAHNYGTGAPVFDSPGTEASGEEGVPSPDISEDNGEDVNDTQTAEPEYSEPEHSELYLPGYSPLQIFEYFEEVVLNTEYSEGDGNTSLVQKWNMPISYRIYGSPTDEDLAVLNDFFDQLNDVAVFPGIYPAAEYEPEALTISFLNHEDFTLSFSDFLNGEDAYGATQYWYYTDTNEIYTANIGYRTDIDQAERSSILIEEIVNMLGISDTVLREDSIVYQYSNTNTALSDVDWVILKLLYDPLIECGADYDRCSACVQELYY